MTKGGATLAMHTRHDGGWCDSCLAPAAFSSNKKKAPRLRGLLNSVRRISPRFAVNYSLVRSLFFDAFRALNGLANFEDVADVMHKAKHAHREEADCIKGEERSNDVLAGVDVF